MFNCDLCEKELEFVLLNGYDVGDRLLEGVIFKISKKKNGKYKAELYNEDDWAYCNRLNMKMFFKDMGGWAGETDIAECPNCGWDVGMNDDYPLTIEDKKSMLKMLVNDKINLSEKVKKEIVPKRIISLKREIEKG